MLDATKSDEQRRLLELELDAVGIRLNKQKPDVVFKKKTTGGVREVFDDDHALLKNMTCTGHDQLHREAHQNGRQNHQDYSCRLSVVSR